jgi:hypothetical protein
MTRGTETAEHVLTLLPLSETQNENIIGAEGSGEDNRGQAERQRKAKLLIRRRGREEERRGGSKSMRITRS